MKKSEAIAMLKTAPRRDKPSRVNPSLTEAQAVDIVEKWLIDKPDDFELNAMFTIRVYQVSKNQRKPTIKL